MVWKEYIAQHLATRNHLSHCTHMLHITPTTGFLKDSGNCLEAFFAPTQNRHKARCLRISCANTSFPSRGIVQTGLELAEAVVAI